MIESLRELEKNIETFQNNVVASNELNDLLRGVIEQAKNTDETFNAASGELLAKLGELPGAISDKNLEYAEAVKQESDDTFTRLSGVFNAGQERYTDILKKTEEQIREAQAATLEEMSAARDTVKAETDRFAETAEKLPETISEKNAEYAEALKDIAGDELKSMLDEFREERAAYMEELQKSEERLAQSEKDLEEKYKTVIDKMNEIANSGILGLNAELDRKMKNQTILIFFMAVITVLIGGRFFF